jgi:tetratricopeptide (TPR) repeat protein
MTRRRFLAPSLALVVGLSGASLVVAEPAPERHCEELRNRGIELLGRSEKEKEPGPALDLARQAVEFLRRATDLCPRDADYVFWLGRAHVFAKDVDGYLNAIRRLRQLAVAGDARTPFLEGEFHLRLGRRLDESIVHFERARRVQPEFLPQQLSILLWNARVQYAAKLVSQVRGAAEGAAESGAFLEPIKQLRLAVLEAGPSPFRRYAARRNLAQVLRLGSEYAESQKVWEGLVESHPQDPVVRYGLATVLADQLKFQEAVTQWEESLRLFEAGAAAQNEPTRPDDLRMRYGVTLRYAGRLADARAALERYVRDAPGDGRGWSYLGLLERDHPFTVVVSSLGRANADEVAKEAAAVARVDVAAARARLEGLPKAVTPGLGQEEADALAATLVRLGAQAEVEPSFDLAIRYLTRSIEVDPACEDPLKALIGVYVALEPDPEKARALEARLNDPQDRRRREAVRRARVLERSDRTEGCK